MALIECPQCGKSISDKASKCLFCGYENIVQEVNNHTKCSECGHILEHSTSVCPVCGCPVENQSQEAESIQRGNETKIHTLHLSKKKSKNYNYSSHFIRSCNNWYRNRSFYIK